MARSFDNGESVNFVDFLAASEDVFTIAFWLWMPSGIPADVRRSIVEIDDFRFRWNTWDPIDFELQARRWLTTNGQWMYPEPATAQWVHIIVTYDYGSTANDPSLYYDNSLQTLRSEAATPAGTPLDSGTKRAILFCEDVNHNGVRFAEWGFWNRILTAAERQTVYDFSPEAVLNGLMGYGPMYGDQSPEPNLLGANGTVAGTPPAVAHPPRVKRTGWLAWVSRAAGLGEASERLPPDGVVFALVNLTGVYTEVDDDPDDPDTEWLDASSNNVNTECRASFGTPASNLVVGADKQEFRALVRQEDETQSGTPNARIELWESGGLIRAGSDTPVPDGGVVLSFTWNASELAGGGPYDGANVECKVVGTKTGGSPTTRNTVEPGAIEWNATRVAAGTTYYQTLDATAIATAGLVTVAMWSLTLAATAVLTAALVTAATWYRTIAASAVGTAVLSTAATWYRTITATAVGTASIGAAKYFVKTLAATAIGTATLATTFIAPQVVSATAVGTAALSRVATWYRTLSATAIGTATLTKKMFVTLAATAVGTANAATTATYYRTLSATAIGTATITPLQVIGVTLSATAIGTAAITSVATFLALLAAVALAVPAIVVVAGKILSATATGVATITTTTTRYVTLSATAVGTASLTAVRWSAVTLSATAVAVANMLTQFIAGGGPPPVGPIDHMKRMIKLIFFRRT
jgi:hypothetical protein